MLRGAALQQRPALACEPGVASTSRPFPAFHGLRAPPGTRGRWSGRLAAPGHHAAGHRGRGLAVCCRAEKKEYYGEPSMAWGWQVPRHLR